MRDIPRSHIIHRAPARWLLLAVAVLLVMQLLGSHAGWRIILIGLGGAWIVGQLWIRALRRGLSIEQDLRSDWAQVGDRMEARVVIRNSSRVPALWVEVEDRSNLPIPPISRSLNVSGGGTRRFLLEFECTRRGEYSVGPMTMKTGDPVGLLELKMHDPALVSFVVLPKIVPIPEIEVLGAGSAGEGRRLRTMHRQGGISSSAREYQAGDPLRWIHWPTTARRDSLFVRSFEEAPAGDWWIVLDVDDQEQRGSGDDSTLERGVSLAAALADRGLRSGLKVGLALGEQRIVAQRTSWPLMRTLAVAQAEPVPLTRVLTGLRSLRRPVSLLIVTPTNDPGWTESLLPLVRKGHQPMVLLTSPDEPSALISRLAGLRAGLEWLPALETTK